MKTGFLALTWLVLLGIGAPLAGWGAEVEVPAMEQLQSIVIDCGNGWQLTLMPDGGGILGRLDAMNLPGKLSRFSTVVPPGTFSFEPIYGQLRADSKKNGMLGENQSAVFFRKASLKSDGLGVAFYTKDRTSIKEWVHRALAKGTPVNQKFFAGLVAKYPPEDF